MKIPEGLAWIAARNPAVQEFVAALPERISELERRWSIRVGEPFDPGGFSSYAARATSTEGKPCVLKIAYEWELTRLEPDALRAWNGDGVVRLLSDEPFTMLLEACEPGEPLYSEAEFDTADSVVIRILKQMWRPAPPDIDWRSVDTESTGIAATIEANHDRSIKGVDLAHVRFAQEFIEGARDHAVPDVLLHGDFHQGNILSSHREGWLAIDPSPLTGDPCFDAARAVFDRQAVILGDSEPARRISQRLRRFAEDLDLDHDTLAGWALTRCLYIALLPIFDESSWTGELGRLVPHIGRVIGY
jgi:streptomycin 6-kinase